MLNGFGLTQQKILEGLLQNKEGMTIDDFVQDIQITRTAVNQHINSLEKDGYVKKHSLTKTGGRPGQIYALTDKGVHLFPKQYAWFCELLLDNLKEELGSKGLENILRKLGVQVAASFSDSLNGIQAPQKLIKIAEIMENLGYAGRVDDDNEDVIRASNCVYHDLAEANPEICSFDLALLSALSGRKVVHVECMVRGGSCCQFKFKEPFKDSYTSDYKVLESKDER